MSRTWLVVLPILLAPLVTQAANVWELRVGGAFGSLLTEPAGDGRAYGVIMTSYAVGRRFGPTERLAIIGTFGIPAAGLGVQVDHAPRTFAVDGPIFRGGIAGTVWGKNCEVRCDDLGVDEFTFATGLTAELGAAWRWTFADDEGGVSVGISGLGARLVDGRNGNRVGWYWGVTLGPWAELDW